MAATIAKVKCSCTHHQQDELYGVGIRIANATQRSPAQGSTEVRCTVCGKPHAVPNSSLK